MPYVSIDELEHFEFHDAEVVSIELKDQCMIWIAKRINATKENTQNHYPADMCVAESEIVFESVEIKGITFLGYKVFNAEHVLIHHEKPQEANPDEFASILNDSLSQYCQYCRIHGMGMEQAPEDGKHKYSATFTIDAGTRVFDILLDFDRAVISWNEFNGKAWYEDDKWEKKRDL